MPVDLKALEEDLRPTGLILRGGFDFRADETRPAGPCGEPAASVVLIGNAGAGYWPVFMRWRKAQPAGLADPLDAWSRTVVEDVAETCRARVIMPSDRPYAPFQRWAMRAEGLRPSPLGILMHPDYGLWHAYRAALLFDVPLSAKKGAGEPDASIHRCDLCVGKFCLNTCPADAFADGGFDHAGCLSHVRSDAKPGCRDGCRARNACPHGHAYRYEAEVQRFHMDHFAR
jgi:hypothetical protein